MALAACRECGKQVSTEALSCPHCGVPRPAARTASAGESPRGYAGTTERILYRTHIHWITMLKGWIAVAVLLAGGVAIWIWTTVELAGVALVVLAVILGVTQYLTYVSSEFAVTDTRVLVRLGWIGRRSIEILITKVESIVVEQTLAGRLFDYGTIVVTGTGGTHEVFTGIAAPLEFRERVQAQIIASR
jgi:uncharacterized membrane protein YdbT with pleckstrin-like domain